MRNYGQITYWENNRRVRVLTEFHSTVLAYFSQAENNRESGIRFTLNLMLREVMEIIYAAGVNPTVQWTQEPALGNRRSNVNLIDNLFNLHSFSIPINMVTDMLERALGAYRTDYRKSVLRTYNPFWWLGLLFGWIAELPFRFIGSAGFNSQSAEQSTVGRLLKLVIWGALMGFPAAAGLLTILDYFSQ